MRTFHVTFTGVNDEFSLNVTVTTTAHNYSHAEANAWSRVLYLLPPVPGTPVVEIQSISVAP